jgi:hypothetical protein
MGRYKFLKEKVILNKKIKIYSKKNSKKLYCKLKTRNKTEMVTIKDYKKMKGGVKKTPTNSQRKKKSINPFLAHPVETQKFAFNKSNFIKHMDLEGT